MSEPINLIINLRIFLNVGIATGDVGLRLIIIKITDEIMYLVVRKKLLKLRKQLCRQSLVVRQHQRRHIPPSNNIRHSKRLARPRHAQQRLLALTLLQTIHQLSNRRRLVAGRLVFGDEIKGAHIITIVTHHNLYIKIF